MKRLRNPDMVCLERLEYFLTTTDKLGLTVLLAGSRSNLLEAVRRIRLSEWFPEDQIFPGGDDDSATLAAVRSMYQRLGDANICEHCRPKRTAVGRARWLYYRV